jgi:hypothetical protein
MKHRSSRELYAYWNDLRAGRAMPDRDLVDPAALRTILADVFILENSSRGEPIFRIAGTRVCGLFGHELKGTPLDEPWAPGDRSRLLAVAKACQDNAVVAVAGVRATSPSQRAVMLEMILLPLRHHGQTHRRMIGSLSQHADTLALDYGSIEQLHLDTVRFVTPGAPELDIERPRPALLPGGGRKIGGLIVFEGGRSA